MTIPRPYPTYKPSGVPWLGDMPAHWDVRRLKDILRERETRSADEHAQLLRVSQYTGVSQRKRTDEGSAPDTRAESLIGYRCVEHNDLVVNIMLAWNGSMGVSRFRGIVSPAYCVYRFSSEVQPWFFHHLLRSTSYKAYIKAESTGVVDSRLRLYTDDLYRLHVFIPPLPEQRAIVRYLDHVNRRVRRYVAAKRRLIGLLKEEKQAIVNQAVTRGLDPNIRFKPSGIERLGDVPRHWEIARLKGHAANVVDLARNKDHDDVYIALENVESWTGRYLPAGDDVTFDSHVKRFAAGDVLFGKLRPYLAKVTCPNQSGVCVGEFLVLRPDTDTVLAGYLEQLLRSKPTIDAIDASTFGAKMPRADWQSIGGMLIALPPLPEQQTIVQYIGRETTRIDAAIALTRRQIELVQEYRTRLIADVVTGKLDVREVATQLPEEDGDEELMDEDGLVLDNEDNDLFGSGGGLEDEPAMESEVAE